MQTIQPRSELLKGIIEGSDLFEEIRQLPGAKRYLDALAGGRAWTLAPGEPLPLDGMRGAYAVLSGSAGLGEAPPSEEGTPPPARRVFGQWTGLRGQPLEEAPVAREEAVILECLPEVLKLLLLERDLASLFKVEFFRPLLRELPVISDAPDDTLDRLVRLSRFGLYTPNVAVVREGERGNTMFVIVEGKVEVMDPRATDPKMGPGQLFGELAVLTHQPRGATVEAREPTLLMECGRLAIAELKKKSKQFRAALETVYRERLMVNRLRQTDLFSGLGEPELRALCQLAQLETYSPYEPVLFQGDTADALYVVLDGTLHVVQEKAEGPVAHDWIRTGEVLGEMGLPDLGGDGVRGRTVHAVQAADLARFPAEALTVLFTSHPAVREHLTRVVEQHRQNQAKMAGDPARAAALGWMMETQHDIGTAVLAVDMSDCIRCGNCVNACAEVHGDGVSRFFWTDMREDEELMPHVRLSTSCHHCQFPLCMVPCPTNALERTDGGAVFIDYTKCIRCGKCADPSQGCPYGSIRLVPVENGVPERPLSFWEQVRASFGWTPPAPEMPERTGPRYPAKCDLCAGMPYQACVQYCPTDAIFRIDGAEQFAGALDDRHQGGRRPPGEPFEVYLEAAFKGAPAAGRPATLEVQVRGQGPGQRFTGSRPEPGVPRLPVNVYLHAADEVGIGGGALRQFVVAPDAAAGEEEYRVTLPKAGPQSITFCVYQGGLYLGRHTLEFEVAPPPPKPTPPPKPAPAAAPKPAPPAAAETPA